MASTVSDPRAPVRTGRLRAAVRVATRLIVGGAGSLLIAASAVSLWTWGSWLLDGSEHERSRGVNALWAGHTWVGDPHSDAEYRELAALLERHQISDVFFHAGPFEADGSVPRHKILYADDLIEAMERYAPDVRAQAYLGQIEDRGGGILDLDDAEVRDGIVDTAAAFVAMGFDGIHYDIEPIYPGDESFLELLERTRAVTDPRGAVLSVALEQAEFPPGAGRLVRIVVPRYHDPPTDFLRDVAERVDQVAIMTYDSMAPADWMFGAHVAWQTERVVEAIGDDVTVFIGVPTYEEGTRFRFHPRAEHVQSGIRGVRKGLDRLDGRDTSRVGVALFAEWTTSDDDWERYYAEWIAD